MTQAENDKQQKGTMFEVLQAFNSGDKASARLLLSIVSKKMTKYSASLQAQALKDYKFFTSKHGYGSSLSEISDFSLQTNLGEGIQIHAHWFDAGNQLNLDGTQNSIRHIVGLILGNWYLFSVQFLVTDFDFIESDGNQTDQTYQKPISGLLEKVELEDLVFAVDPKILYSSIVSTIARNYLSLKEQFKEARSFHKSLRKFELLTENLDDW